MPILVIRPGETEYDTQDRVQGALNLPLTERGSLQVDELIETVRQAAVDRIYSSPSEPALSTARRVADALNKPLKVLEALANVDLGLWQGLCIKEIRTRQPRVFKQWEESPDSVCPPQGESGEDACHRVAVALKKPLKKKGSFAIVASEPLASLIECHLSGADPDLTESFCKARSARVNEVPAPNNGHTNSSGK